MGAAPHSDRTEPVSVDDGTFDLHVWLPKAGRGPGLLLLQEIFGVGPYIVDVAHRLCDLGYVVGAPDLYWRVERNWTAEHTAEGMAAAMEMVAGGDLPQGIADCVAALHVLETIDAVDGPSGVIGFCLGGTLAWFVAAVSQPAATVSYYGSGVAGGLTQLDNVHCPVLLHFGEADPFIPGTDVERITKAVRHHPGIEVHVQPHAGHAFDNHHAPQFHHADASAAAWDLTRQFLARYLPVPV